MNLKCYFVVSSLQGGGPVAFGRRIATAHADDVVLVAHNIGEDDVLRVRCVDSERLVDFNQRIQGQYLVVER